MEALALLGENLAHPAHEFWTDGLQVPPAVKGMEARLQYLVGSRFAKGVDEELRIENALGNRASHRSGSGDVISTPDIARVPSTSSRWNTARSSARSIASVAVAGPSALALREHDLQQMRELLDPQPELVGNGDFTTARTDHAGRKTREI